MADVHACPECGAELPAEAPQAPCSACLMKVGMKSWAASQGGADAGNGPASSPARTILHPFAAPAPADLAGHFPQLEIIELRGQGGMGAVYKARQKSLDRLVALKIINPEAADEPGFESRFAREARALARLNHPSIVGVYDFGQTDGLYYLIMEYVDGVDLRSVISDGKLQPAEALALVPQICDALQYAHEEAIVHRDIKPENILVDKRGRVKIADFGLAKLLRLSAVEMTLTHTRQVVGTFHYMAPEQFERPGEVDHRVDIYALGVVFYEMLTGMLPVGRFDLPSQRCAVDARLDDVVLRALEREPDRRYQHASDVKTDVESLDAYPRKLAPAVPQARFAPDHSDAMVLEEARQSVVMLAIGLIVYGCLALLGALGTLLGVSYAEIVHNAFGSPGGNEALSLIGGGCILAGILGSVVLATGINLRNLQNFELAVAGTIVTLLTALPLYTALFALPLGIGSLWLLRQPNVRRAFALQRRLEQADPERAARRGARRRMAGPAWGLVAIGVINAFVPVFAVAMFPEYDRDLVWPVLLSIPSGVIMLIGALAMLRLGSRELALVGAAAAMVPCGPMWLLSLPLGIAAILVLRTPEVKSQFGRWTEPETSLGPPHSEKPPRRVDDSARPAETASDVETIRELVKVPALALVGVGVFSLVSAVVGLAIGFVLLFGYSNDRGFYFALALGHAIPIFLAAPVMIVGGLRMKHLESRWLALTAAIVAFLPLNVSWFVGLPVAIWTLILLNRRDVEQAFRAQHYPLSGLEGSLRKVSALLIAAAGLHLACLAPFWVIYFVLPPDGSEWWPVTIGLGVATVAIILTSLTIVLGAVPMRRMQRSGWSRAAAIAALLPVSPAVLLSLPTGLCALALVTRPGVQEWFATPPAKEWQPVEAEPISA